MMNKESDDSKFEHGPAAVMSALDFARLGDGQVA